MNSLEKVEKFLEKIDWLKSSHPYGGACICIDSDKVIYVDPSQVTSEQELKKADLILITHSHDDHFSIETIKKLTKDDTLIICPKECKDELLKTGENYNIRSLIPIETENLDSIIITAIPAYSLAAHPRSAGWVGYEIIIEGCKIYHSGDCGMIDELKNLKDIDIAFLTTRHPYMMSPNEMIEAIKIIRPKICVPLHWIEEEYPEIEKVLDDCPDSTKICIL